MTSAPVNPVQAPSSVGVADVVLEAVLGPPLAPVRLTPGKAVTLGRLPECTIQLPESEKTVSRKHCTLEARSGAQAGWYITDEGSRHGTFLNNTQLPAGEARAFRPGDTIRIGPWVFRVAAPDARPAGTMTTDDTGTAGAQLVTITQVSQQAIDRRRLELLIRCAKEIQAATDERQLAECVVGALLDGTGYPRVAIVRPGAAGALGGSPAGARGAGPAAAEAISVLASRTVAQSSAAFQFSRSLVAAALGGQMVQLKFDDHVLPAVSIMSVGMTTAMAVPVFLDQTVSLCFYLDARREDRPVHDDAAAFCQAIAEMCSLALASMQRTRLHVERMRMAEQMEAALQIQRQILPAPRGRYGPLEYALELIPGRFVAGDLFDILRLDERRVAFFIGDVAGKGVPAAILMATTQSYLNAALLRCDDPAEAVSAVNAHLMAHAPDNKFVSLWVGVLDLSTGSLRFCDAGHGYCMLAEPGRGAESIEPTTGKGLPLRVLADAGYESEERVLRPGSRVVLFSDGVVEQVGSTDGSGEQPFGVARVARVLSAAAVAGAGGEAGGVGDDVLSVVRAVQTHAGTEALDDDLTVVSICFGGGA